MEINIHPLNNSAPVSPGVDTQSKFGGDNDERI